MEDNVDVYLELMRDLHSLKKDDLVVFGRNIGMIDVNLTASSVVMVMSLTKAQYRVRM